jgi:type I thyroxine 5'-deiodinase
VEQLRRKFADRAEFLTVYIKEAHPEDEWQMDINEDQGVCYKQPTTIEQRVFIAKDFIKRFDYQMSMMVDPMNNPAEEAYAAWPERLYVIDETGTVAYKGGKGPFGFDPDELEAWLDERLAS